MSPDRRILVVDDEPHILEVLRFLLNDEGYEVATAETGRLALGLVENHAPNLIILDVALPDIDGFAISRRLQGRGIPILMLSSHDRDEDVINGLEYGAMDYVRKPFNHRELILRIEKLLTRPVPSPTERRLSSGELMIDTRREAVIRGKKQIHLSPTEYRLLLLMMESRGAVVTWQEILRRLWGREDWLGGREMVKVNIRRLRRRVEIDPAHPRYILNQWGRGYRFAVSVTTTGR